LKTYTITADEDELAGDEFHSFLGFFDKKFRLHDYNVGHRNAINFLGKLKTIPSGAGEEKPLVLKNFDENNLPKIDSSLGSANFGAIPEVLRKKLKKIMLNAICEQVDCIEKGWLTKTGIKIAINQFIGAKLDEALDL